MAGLTGALIVLPQGVAFAIIAGLPPEYGLYAAMMPAIVAALFGSSWHLVSGPTTAISIAVFASVSPYAPPGSPEFISLVLTLTFLTGVFQLALGLARMGVLVNFISHTVVIGFTAGAALLIAGSQIKNFFGVDIPRGTPFFQTLELFALQVDRINPYVLAVSLTTLGVGILTKHFVPKLPYMIVGMVAGSLFAVGLNAAYGVEVTQVLTVGALPSGLPPLSVPDFSFHGLSQMLFPALIITMLALTEAVSISRAIATRSGQHIDGNQEFIGQGLSNLVGSFFSGYAASGSFNRSGVNYAADAKTPLAAVYASLFLVVILLLVAPLASYLPNATMAGILFLVGVGADRLPSHRPAVPHQPAGKRGVVGHPDRHPDRPGKRHFLRDRPVPGAVPPTHVASHPGSRGAGQRPQQLSLRARRRPGGMPASQDGAAERLDLLRCGGVSAAADPGTGGAGPRAQTFADHGQRHQFHRPRRCRVSRRNGAPLCPERRQPRFLPNEGQRGRDPAQRRLHEGHWRTQPLSGPVAAGGSAVPASG
jgi:hypothetical protein